MMLFNSPDKRLMVMKVSLPLLGELLFNTRVSPDGSRVLAIEIEGIPEDARIERIDFDPWREQALLRIWSSSFPSTVEGAHLPEMNVQVTQREYQIVARAEGQSGFGPSGFIVVSPDDPLMANAATKKCALLPYWQGEDMPEPPQSWRDRKPLL